MKLQTKLKNMMYINSKQLDNEENTMIKMKKP